MVTALSSWELDMPHQARWADFAVEVKPATGGHPAWYVYLHGPGGQFLAASSELLSHAIITAGDLLATLGGIPPRAWAWGGPLHKAAVEREGRYKDALREARAKGLGYWQEMAAAAEAVDYPNARDARWAAERY